MQVASPKAAFCPDQRKTSPSPAATASPSATALSFSNGPLLQQRPSPSATALSFGNGPLPPQQSSPSATALSLQPPSPICHPERSEGSAVRPSGAPPLPARVPDSCEASSVLQASCAFSLVKGAHAVVSRSACRKRGASHSFFVRCGLPQRPTSAQMDWSREFAIGPRPSQPNDMLLLRARQRKRP
jgi:hypothetical protein